MDSNMKTFEEAKHEMIEMLKREANNEMNKYKEVCGLLSNVKSPFGLEFDIFNSMLKNHLENINLCRRGVKGLITLDYSGYGVESSKWVSGVKKSTAIVLVEKKDENWKQELFCTIEDMGELTNAIFNKDHTTFYNSLHRITGGKRALSERFTREIFGKSPKHRKLNSLDEDMREAADGL